MIDARVRQREMNEADGDEVEREFVGKARERAKRFRLVIAHAVAIQHVAFEQMIERGGQANRFRLKQRIVRWKSAATPFSNVSDR
ncbi:hypothetical protein [Paraburkholderia sp. UCT2]|uniref:hypothetical protein n=1 Tax=Paraburkholderia sp. UCT2 TaxID=2615208 RepID=UPI001655C09A|nr:hypothetical protein [Paraburkholderia sp. UCT2]MBC8729387.1 hypothetical protein [Paraburkholderia sp. UCT2]